MYYLNDLLSESGENMLHNVFHKNKALNAIQLRLIWCAITYVLQISLPSSSQPHVFLPNPKLKTMTLVFTKQTKFTLMVMRNK